MKIKITNSKGQSISASLPIDFKKEDLKQDIFAKRMLSFAEIALGKTA